MLASVVLGPVIACIATMGSASHSSQKFISEGDGSTGPAFWFCIGVWIAIVAVGALLATIVLVSGRQTPRT